VEYFFLLIDDLGELFLAEGTTGNEGIGLNPPTTSTSTDTISTIFSPLLKGMLLLLHGLSQRVCFPMIDFQGHRIDGNTINLLGALGGNEPVPHILLHEIRIS
jgi:hypothetical protein